MDSLQSKINTIYIFGDSLHDTGNLKRLTNGKIPSEAYFRGHFSNGPMYSEYLADIIAENTGKPVKVNNYAIGGALTAYINGYVSTALSLQAQIESKKFAFKETDLLILGGGSNNYVFCIDFKFPFIHLKRISKLVNDLRLCIDKVLEMGAKNVILFNMPDLFMAPVKHRLGFIFRRFIMPAFSKSIVRANEKIEAFAKDLKNKGIQIKIFDIYGLLLDAFESPQKFGFKYSDSCIIPGLGRYSGEVSKQRKHEDYLFWDYVHPTTKAHKLIALYLVNLLKEI